MPVVILIDQMTIDEFGEPPDDFVRVYCQGPCGQLAWIHPQSAKMASVDKLCPGCYSLRMIDQNKTIAEISGLEHGDTGERHPERDDHL